MVYLHVLNGSDPTRFGRAKLLRFLPIAAIGPSSTGEVAPSGPLGGYYKFGGQAT